MKKLLKIVGIVIAILIIVPVLLVATTPLWFGPVAKGVANAVVPSFTRTDFHLGGTALNPYTGRFSLDALHLANPAGYDESEAVSVGAFAVEVDVPSFATDVWHIREITLADAFVSIVSKDGVGNFEQIQYNVAGGREKYEAKQAEAKRAEASVPAKEEPAAEAGEGPRFVIDRISLTGLKVKYAFVSVPLPPIVLTDIGKDSGGASLTEIWAKVTATVMESVLAAGDALGALGKGTLNLGAGVFKTGSDLGIDKAAKELGETAAEVIIEGADSAVKMLKGLFK